MYLKYNLKSFAMLAGGDAQVSALRRTTQYFNIIKCLNYIFVIFAYILVTLMLILYLSGQLAIVQNGVNSKL